MRVSDFDFELPHDRIALRPVSPRDSAKLLQIKCGTFTDTIISELPGLLKAGDVLVVNKTRVIPARLHGVRVPREGASDTSHGGPRIEVTLHKRLAPHLWAAFAKPGKKLAPGDRIVFEGALTACVEEKRKGGEILLAFGSSGTKLDAAITTAGEMPLPPYIAARRAVDEQDNVDYQTLFAREDGSVAAPTAGLHFTPELGQALDQAGIRIEEVTLHVGAGTFLPVKSTRTEDHKMHSEWGQVTGDTADVLNQASADEGRIIAVGTTSLRILETAARADGKIAPFEGETDIFITPGYQFRAVDGLLTNFHLPRSTLFMLVSAFAGLEAMKAAYAHAIEAGYRFYSYGDACLLWPGDAS
ncbi:tRNA preQ1(34) S-adenosylmethionine ribosyltransferase-isomerase QueA [bacterium AH-315-P15]|nr:tRNA preQ1(34) S-adenosylmethionine ribosyltransferase-isomerase QueA [bacterium AH-315-P15]